MTNILIVQARFYDDVADHLLAGASAALQAANATFDVVEVPGALEIPPAIGFGLESGKYDGFVALGCVIRGETTHYDYVCGESARGLMDLGLHFGAAVGNGILTVENREQALVRADIKQKNKGASAVEAALALIRIQDQMAIDA